MTKVKLYRCAGCGRLVSKVYEIGIYEYCYDCAVQKGYRGNTFVKWSCQNQNSNPMDLVANATPLIRI